MPIASVTIDDVGMVCNMEDPLGDTANRCPWMYATARDELGPVVVYTLRLTIRSHVSM